MKITLPKQYCGARGPKNEHLRIGQDIFNFLQFLLKKGYAPPGEQQRMADPFYLSDEEWNKYYEEYVASLEN